MWVTGAFQPWAIQQNLKWFLILSGVSVALFFFFLKNPLFLPLWTLKPKFARGKTASATPSHRREAHDVDAILDKISVGGVESLTVEEKAYLNRVSTKYQSRAQSEMPKSDLII